MLYEYKMIKKYLTLFSILGASFLVSHYAANNIFLAKTPRLNPNYLTNLKADLVERKDKIMLALSSIKIGGTKNTVAQNEIKNIPESFFKPVSKGVSAYEKGNGEVVLKIDNRLVNVEPRKIEINGKTVEVLDLTGE